MKIRVFSFSFRTTSVLAIIALLMIYVTPSLPMQVDVEAAASVTLMLYNFVNLADESEDVVKWWTGDPASDYSQISFGGPDTDPDGFAMYKNNVKLNDGNTYAKVLETHPKWVDNGLITANYYNIYIPKGGATLKAKVGFIYGGTAGDTLIHIRLHNDELGYIYLVDWDNIDYAGGVKTYSIPIPDEARGKTFTFAFTVHAHGTSAQDWVAWPELYMIGKFVMDVDVEDTVIEVTQGESESTVVHITGDYPFAVDLAATDLPAGVSASFSPSFDVLPFDAVLTISASEDAATGTFSIHVKAKDGSYIQETKTIMLKVNPKEQPDFEVDVAPPSVTVNQGETAAYSVSVSPSGGFDKAVTLHVSGLPPGATYEFNPSSGVPPFASSLIIETSEDTPPGTYHIQVTGSDGGKSHSETIDLVVEEAPDFDVDVAPDSASIMVGESADFTVEVTALGGFGEEVELSVSGLPDGASATFSPEFGVPDFSSTLIIETLEDTPPGTYDIEVTGTGGGKSHSAMITLEVAPPPDFTITIEPDSALLLPGESTEFTVSIEPVGGWGEEVSLYTVDAPDAFEIWFEDESGAPPFDTTMALTVSEDAEPGTYNFRIIGESGETRRSFALSVEVLQPPDFSISLSQSSVTMTQGESVTLTVTLEKLGDFDEPVSLSVPGLPLKVSASFSANNVAPPFTSTLTIAAQEDAPPGSWNLVVEGAGGGLARTAALELTVEEAPQPFDFELSASQTSLTLKTNQRSTVVITVTLVSGEPEEVALSVIGLPSSVSYSLTPSAITPTGAVTLELTAGAEPGVYSFVIQGQGGEKMKTLMMSLKVEEERRCLIATAAFGSELAAPVQTLREYRDGFVLTTFAGSKFMDFFNAFYYLWSPYVAHAEHENPVLKETVKAMIYPLIGALHLSRLAGSPLQPINPEASVVAAGITASILLGLIYLAPISALARKALKENRPKIGAKYPLISLAASLLGLAAGELLGSGILVAISSASIVLSSMVLGAYVPFLLAKRTNKTHP